MMPCLANGNSPSVVPFQCYAVKCPLLLNLPLDPKLRESRPHATTCYMVTTGSLHLVEPQAPLPAGYPADSSSVEAHVSLPSVYPADYTNCITDLVCDTNCPAVHTVR